MPRTVRFVTLTLALAALACSVTIPSFTGVTGSGNVISLVQDVSGFDRLHINHAFQATVTQGDSYSVVIRIDDNLERYLRVEQNGDTLSIGLEDNVILGPGSATLEVDITMPSLKELQASGASEAQLTGFASDGGVDLGASGASSISGDLQAGQLALVLSGASSATLGGTAQDLTVVASGASVANMGDFAATDVVVTVSGASSATVDASGTLDVSASGASQVTYLGNPSLGEVNVTGASSLEAK